MAGSGVDHLRQRDDLVLQIVNLTVEFPVARGEKVHAVSDLSFDVAKGETLGLVGESGCGKSSTGRAIMQLPRPNSGTLMLNGQDLMSLNTQELRNVRTRLQMIFQDPVSSINPRRKIRDVVAEGLSIWESKLPSDAVRERVDEVLDAVGLDPDSVGDRRAHQFSGGQCQRICIARALVMNPEIVICDEPVSALDVSIQAQILNLLEAMKERFGISLIFISHDLAVVKAISDRVGVLYLGKLCEIATADELYRSPAHPYTQALLDAVLDPDGGERQRTTLGGELPSPLNPPSGCRFRTRCPKATERCAVEEPVVRRIGDDHFVACHYPDVA